jgi:leucyl-tRNA synthetase
MAVPAHDKRDFDFATLFKLPIKQVIGNSSVDNSSESLPITTTRTDDVLINSGEFSGLSVKDATDGIISRLEGQAAGSRQEMSRLRDWVFSRQRYWGVST